MNTEALMDAGRRLATVLEDYIQSCGNSPPECTGCADCNPARDAIAAWMQAVWDTRQLAHRLSQPATARLVAVQRGPAITASAPTEARGCGPWRGRAE